MFCGQGSNFLECIAALKAEQPTDYASQVSLFRSKAKLVDLLGTHLDNLTEASVGMQ